MRTSVEVQPKQKSALTYNSKIIKTIIAAIHDKKGEEVVSMNLKKIPESIADFFIVCEASNPNLLKAIADHVEKQVKEDCDEWPHRMEGKQGDKWILIDYVNVVVHCLLPESRSFYNLEELWQDAEQRQHSA